MKIIFVADSTSELVIAEKVSNELKDEIVDFLNSQYESPGTFTVVKDNYILQNELVVTDVRTDMEIILTNTIKDINVRVTSNTNIVFGEEIVSYLNKTVTDSNTPNQFKLVGTL